MEAYQKLELEFGLWAGCDNIVACSSGTAALHLALEAFRFPPGSEVIIPDFTMIACARACTLAGLTPVFVDCNDSLLIDPALIESGITDKTVAIMPVHIYGRHCDMVAITNIAAKHRLRVIEDRAEYHVPFQGDYRPDAACWSFYKNKVIHGEEGGAVFFRDQDHAKYAESLRCLGFTESHDFQHIPRGHNYRMSNLHASEVLTSLSFYEGNHQTRRRLERYYNVLCPEPWRMPHRDSPWVYDVKVPNALQLVTVLNSEGIPARMAFCPLSWQKEYRGSRRVVHPKYGTTNSKAMDTYFSILYLPLTASMSRETCQNNMRRLIDLAVAP